MNKLKIFLLTLGILLHGLHGMAQYTVTPLTTGGYNTGLAKDMLDNIYTVRYFPLLDRYQVGKHFPANIAAGIGMPAASLTYMPDLPWGITVNSLGDVFVINSFATANGQIIKLTAPGYTPTVVQTGRFFTAITSDSHNNLLTLEYNSLAGTYRVMRYAAGSENGGGTSVYDGLTAPPGDGSYPWGIVADSHDNIYILDFLLNSGGQLIKLTAPGYAPTVLGSNRSFTSLAIDAFDNIYTTEALNGTQAQVVKYTAPVQAAQAGKVLYAGLTNGIGSYPWGLAVNSKNEIFVNDGAAAGGGRMIRLTAPLATVLSSVRADATPTNAGSVAFTVTFSDDVDNVTAASFSLATVDITGASVTSVTGSGSIYTVTVNTGTGDGILRLDVNGSGILPAFAATPYTAGEVYTIDKTAPTGTLAINAAALYTNDPDVTLGITAVDVSATKEMRFSSDNVSWTAWETVTATKSFTLVAGDALKTVYMELRDGLGNVMSAINAQITLDQALPNTSITQGPATATNNTSASFIFASSEGTGGTFHISVDGGGIQTATESYPITGLAEGVHILTVVAVDQAGNEDATPATYAWRVDVTRPFVTTVGVPANGYYKEGANLDFTVNCNEIITVSSTGGTPYINVNIGGTLHNAMYVSGTGPLLFRYTVTAGETDMNGISLSADLVLNGGTVNDEAGNAILLPLNNIAPLTGVFVNTTIPSVTLSTPASANVNTSFTVTITFSEAVTGLVTGDLTVSGATLGAPVTTDNITYTILVTPTTQGAVSVSLPADATLNIGGNGNTASNTLSLQYDNIAPAINSVTRPTAGNYNIGAQLDFKVNYSENVTVSGTPYLNVIIGGTTYTAEYIIGSGSSALTFRYTILGGELETTNVTMGASIVLNGGTIKDAATNNASVVLQNPGADIVKVYGIRPSVALSTTATDPVGAPYTLSVTFSELVSGFVLTDLTITNATVSNLQTTDDITYTLLVTPLAQGAITVQLPADQVLSAYANNNTASNVHTIDFDNTAPAVTSVGVPANGYYDVGANLDFTVTYNETVNISTAGGIPYISVDINGTLRNAMYVSGTAPLLFRYTVAAGETDLDGISLSPDLVLNGATIRDVANNTVLLPLNGVPSLVNVRVSTIKPTVTLSATAAADINTPFTITITFNEVVTGLSTVDFIATRAAVSMLQTTDNITYTLLVTPSAQGAVSINLPAGVAVNGLANTNAASNTLNFQYDNIAPVINSVNKPLSGDYNIGDVLTFIVNYSENVIVSGTPYLDVIIGSTTYHADYAIGSGTNALTFNYTIQGGELETTNIGLGLNVILNGGTIRDIATNDASVLLQNINPAIVKVYGIRPSVVLSTTATNPVRVPYTLTATFSELVSDFVLADLTVTNATLSDLQTANNITYTMLVTPLADGPVTIELPADKVLSAYSNGNTASNVHTIDFDNSPPAVTSVDVPANGYYKTGQVLTFTVHYDENVTVSVTNGVPYIDLHIGASQVKAVFTNGSGTNTLTFNYTVVNGDVDENGITLGTDVIFNGGTIKDVMGDDAVTTLQGVGNTTGVLVYTATPAVTLTYTAGLLVNAPFSIQLLFSETVTGLTIGDIVVTNATVSDLQTTDNITYTALITPVADGAVSIQLPANTAVNKVNNGNTVSNILSTTYDRTAPVITLVSVPANGSYKVNSTLSFTVHTSEVIQGTGAPYLQVVIGATMRQAAYVSGFGTNALIFSYVVQEGEMDLDGITLGANLIPNGATLTDDAVNDLVPALQNINNTTGVLVNTSHPAVVLSTAAAARLNAPYSITIAFSEAVTGFAITDLTLTNATAGNVQTTDNITYTALITPIADGTVTIQLSADRAENIGANGNTASNSLSNIYDGTAPFITSVTVPTNGYYKANSTLNFTVQTSEAIQGSGMPFLQLLIGSTIRQATYVSGLGTNALTFSYVVQDGEMDMDGIALSANLMPNGATLKDNVGNNMVYTLQNAGNTQGVFVNTSSPSVVLSTTAAASVNAPYPVTITFSEAVTGFAATDLTVTNGTAGNLQIINNITYTVLITPTADGAVTIQLPADRAENIGANGNTASNSLSNNYNGTPPVISAGQTFSLMENDAVGTVAGTVNATNATGTLQNWTIATDGSGGAFAISANGTITVKDVALLNSKAGTTVTLNITVSDGLNASAQTPVNVVIKAINKAPAFDLVADQDICITTATQTFSITGATATEAGQTFGFTISADQPLFDVLTINAAGLVSYKLKTSAIGRSTITIIIKDNGGTVNGGVDVFQRTFALNVNSLPVVNITSNKGTTVSKGEEVQLTASGASTYSWGAATGAVFTVRPQANTTYSVTGTNAAGCPGTAQITINITEDFKVDAINILTPNGDGVNDKWIIRNLDSYPNNELKIFDRSGRIVYQRRNYSNDWDGTMNGRRLPEGTYYYILTIDGSGKTVKGYITLISDQK